MRKIQFLATEPHFVDHLLPVYNALPDDVKGEFCLHPKNLTPGMITAVASWGSYTVAQRRTAGPIIFFEHGAGFTYENNHPSYAGGPGRDKTILFCNVNEYAQEKNSKAYPQIKNVIVGSPKLDSLLNIEKSIENKPKVAFSWHWDCKVTPETRTAFPHYRTQLKNIIRKNNAIWEPLGHSHPRGWPTMRQYYRRNSWEIVENFDEILRRADIYVCDTSSTIYEFVAVTNRPVVVLNAPYYRKEVNHGLRFWENIPGLQVENPLKLSHAINEALFNDNFKDKRIEITKKIYPFLGSSVQQAAKEILNIL